MALPYKSIATISSPEFINLQPLDINPLMSSCEIKVLYIGENRNRSYISKEVATEMAKTLRGAPIVGYYKENKQDFADHGGQVVFDDEGIHFNCLTRPYGFVAPDAKVWFQKFQDEDGMGNTIERQYMMTTGFLWTGQFEQVKSVLTEGKGQSMELDDQTIDGHWATNVKNNIEFFIINDATFTKLCILGDQVEPCFQGASIGAPEISKNFSKDLDDNFKSTLFSMMKELQDALKGGNSMGQEENLETSEEFTVEEVEASDTVEEPVLETSELNEDEVEVTEEPAAEVEEAPVVEEQVEFAKKEQDEEEEKSDESEEDSEQSSETQEDKDEEQDEKKKYSLLEEQYNDLSAQYEQLKADYDVLVAFKKDVENKQKDALINEFYMLSDEDKKDVIENKEKYSLDEIKAKLAIICFEKKVNFNSENSEKNNNNTDEEIITYNYNSDDGNLPDWVKAVKNNIQNNDF